MRLQIFILITVLLTPIAHHAAEWKTVANGIQYIDIENHVLTPWSHIHVFRIDLTKNRLRLLHAADFSRLGAYVDEFASKGNALIAVNAGFFDAGWQPLGLRIDNYKQYSKLKPISWWGVFYLANNNPHIVSQSGWQANKSVQMAIQSGPRLIINGKIPSLKPGLAERSAIGITANNEIILLATENTPMTTKDLAELMRMEPIGCKNALNLDGGSSTQIHSRIPGINAKAQSFAAVSDAILVIPLEDRPD